MFGTYERLNVHVCAPWQSVVRAARTKINKNARRDPAMREKRKQFYRVMLSYHDKAYDLYRFAMVG